jgi:hypothetical protein
MSDAPRLGSLDQAVAALRDDLLAESGPRIGTVRRHQFAILPYSPADEFKLRMHMRRLTDQLLASGWGVLPISLQTLFIERIEATGADSVTALVAREKRLYDKDPARALTYLRDRIAPHIEGPNGIAAEVVRLIEKFAAEHPDRADQTLILIGRAGALYPFFRSSALLKHIDGKTKNIPVVLLYPGTWERQGDATALSFMGELEPDRDYRPRIYV